MPKTFQQNIKFRSVPEQVVDEVEFSGGLITDKHETKLEPNQSPDMANVVFNETGSIKTRNGYLRYNGNSVGAAADQSNTGASTGSLAITTYLSYVAQTYQASGAINCIQADVYMAMNTNGQEQYIRCELWATSGGVPTTLIDNGQAQIKLVSGTSETAYSYRFRVAPSNAASTTYALIVKPFVRGSSQVVNQVNVYHRGATYADGQVLTSSDGGLNWTADSAKDLRFVIYSGAGTGCSGLIRFYTSTGIQQLIAKFGATLYRGNDITGALTALTMGSGISFTSANFLDWTISNNTLLVVDDDHNIQKYRGSTNANYSTGTITVTNASATVTGSGTSWATTTNAEVGEYIQLPDTKWYRITNIASNTSLTIEVAYQASTLAGQSYTISPWGEVKGKLGTSTAPASLVVPQPRYIENHLNRIWALDGNTLRFTVLDTSVTEAHFNDWDSPSNAGSVIIPSGKGDSGTGLHSQNGYLYIFQKHALWEIYGTSFSNFELRNISNEVGMIDKRTLVEYDRYMIFFSGKDIYMFDGANLKNLTDGRINKLISTWANNTSPTATLWGNRYVLSYTPAGGSTNSEAIYYDITRDVFGKLEGVNAGAWSNWNGGTDTGQIYFGSSNQGSIYRWDTGGHDDGYEITTRYVTPSFGFGAAMNDKSAKKYFLQQLALGDWDMTVTQTSDISASDISSDINLSGGGSSLWDVAQWDVDSWSAEGSLITTRIPEFQGLAKYFKYTLEQTGYAEGMEILNMVSTARVRRLQ